MPKHIHHHYAPSVTSTHHDTHHLFNCTHIHTTLSPLDLWTDPAGVTCTAVQMDGEAGWWTARREHWTPPLARVMGVGRQQQIMADTIIEYINLQNEYYFTIF